MLEIIPFISFENHNDKPRDLEFMGEYFINYLRICSFISHGFFTAGNMLKQNSILIVASGKFLEALKSGIGTCSVFCYSVSFMDSVLSLFR